MNLGGPSTLKEVHPFLLRLFSDPDLIPLPFQQSLAKWIARRRSPKIEKQYAEIGGGSPILSWTQKQAQLLEAHLDNSSPNSAPHKCYIAFRYAEPLTETTVQQMLNDNVKRAIAFTQYPQYSCSTTGSSLNELRRQLLLIDPKSTIEWSVIDRWAESEGFIQALSERVETALNSFPLEIRPRVPILFSAHSLPMTVVNRGDPYPHEVSATVAAVMRRLKVANPYRVVWQSQVGPQPWLGPKTDKSIAGLAKRGVREALLVPVAFTSDHIETLFELDLEVVELANKNGMTMLKRSESLNDSPLFIDAMAKLVKEHLSAPAPAAKMNGQLLLQCPGCQKSSCRDTKAFFNKPHLPI